MSGKNKTNHKKTPNNNHNNHDKVKDKTTTTTKNNLNQLKIFEETKKKHLAAAQKHSAAYESSSDEETESDSVLESVFKSYGGDKKQLKKTQEFLENVFQSGAATCLICIATVKRSDYIWSCENCYSFFHLNCTQRWSRDSVAIQRLHLENDVAGYYNNRGEYIVKNKKEIKWCCPKCRFEYLPEQTPREYSCFCTKSINPENHAWLVPHSCGEICGKQLDCEHKCVLLCHPGPCPPCPQIINKSCECGKSNPRTIRCIQQSWKCASKCNHRLSCGIHNCEVNCHQSDKCPPCTKKKVVSCKCGNRQMERNCIDSTWLCDKICNKIFECGLHKCKEKCHAGSCGKCPFGMPRSCPCGKEKSEAPCSEIIAPCGNTCQKTLECGIHICVERCHKGDCASCLTITEKKCRCGLYSKELPCSKQYLCDSKCKRIKDCNKHPCNRKCCDGNCTPCDKVCGKILSCGKHKCTSQCHQGPCYPCELKAQVRCRCGNTVINVPCGREKKTKSPKCQLPCKIQSKCHHLNEHKCHINDCPPCVQKCLLKNDTTGCEHLCPVKCHDAVKMQIIDKNFKPAGPWDVQPEKFEIRKLPHPKCEVKVAVQCIGGHVTELWPCWNSKPMSCGRICGRKLKCTNHACEQLCHNVKIPESKELDENCNICTEGCMIKRPDGCIHPCTRRCHIAPCEPCNVITKTTCHCGLSQVYYKCSEFYPSDNKSGPLVTEEREKALSCGNRCIKNFPCGHRCTNTCHSGKCLNPESCRKKMKIYCDCKNKKLEITCDKQRSGFVLNCDQNCQMKQDELKKIAEEKERKKKELEEEQNRLELEEFEKKFGKKKHKERKTKSIVEKTEPNYLLWIGGAVSVIILSIIIYYVFLF